MIRDEARTLQATGAKLAAFFLQDIKIKNSRTVSHNHLLPTSGERYICWIDIYRIFVF